MPRYALPPPPARPILAAVVALWGLAFGCNADLAFERGAGAFCDGPGACPEGLYCDPDALRCEPLRAEGEPCTAPQQCSEGLCVHGYCCDGPCNQACLSCGLVGSLGRCSAVPEGIDPEDQCPGTAVCSDVARCQGTHLWSRRIGSPDEERATKVAVAPDGVVVVTGSFEGSLTIGTDELESEGGRDVFVAAFDEGPAGPAPIWAVAFGSTGDDEPMDLVVDSLGRSVVVGRFEAPMTVVDKALFAVDTDAFVVRLAADGQSAATVFALSGLGVQVATSVALDEDDAVVVGGVYDQEIRYEPTDTVPSAGGTDAFIARLEATGEVVWHRELGDAQDQRCEALGVAPGGDVIAALGGRGAVDTGGGSITGSLEDDDLFLVRLDASSGAGGPVLLFGGQGEQSATAIAVDDQSEIWLAGRFTRELLVPGGPTLVGGEDVDGFYTKLSANSTHLASAALSGPFDDEPIDLTIDVEGNAIIVGRFELQLVIGETEATIDANGSADLFLLKLDATAEPLWTQPYGGLLADRAVSVATADNGDVIAIGDFEASIAFSESSLQAAGATDLFIAKFAR